MDYYAKALKASDKRYATVLRKLGYGPKDMPKEKPVEDDITAIRARYTEITGKRPFMGWDAQTLKAKLDEYIRS